MTTTSCYTPELKPSMEVSSSLSSDQQYLWCEHVGKALSVMIQNAGYSSEFQHRASEFFAQLSAPNLGVFGDASNNYTRPWSSFMTDDGTPVELSWDWGTNDSQPTIRYSIEPIGPEAGTSLDPTNSLAGATLQRSLERCLPDMQLQWFHHFSDFFQDRKSEKSGQVEDVKDHNTSLFYAFDLSEQDTMPKVYFFPKYRAASRNQTNLSVISDAIRAAPHCTEEKLRALAVFLEFTNDPMSQDIEYDMLAIDLIDPLESRIKIYFRTRETTFASVVNVMTLGGRIKNPKLQQGLGDLHRLWDGLFGQSETAELSLPVNKHRTAGILYNVEFRLGELSPVAKIYLPVRHYSKSDDAVITALDGHFKSYNRGRYMPAYRDTMTKLYGHETLKTQSGIHTYIGCAIRPSGALRVVSYFKPLLPQPLPDPVGEEDLKLHTEDVPILCTEPSYSLSSLAVMIFNKLSALLGR